MAVVCWVILVGCCSPVGFQELEWVIHNWGANAFYKLTFVIHWVSNKLNKWNTVFLNEKQCGFESSGLFFRLCRHARTILDLGLFWSLHRTATWILLNAQFFGNILLLRYFLKNSYSLIVFVFYFIDGLAFNLFVLAQGWIFAGFLRLKGWFKLIAFLALRFRSMGI